MARDRKASDNPRPKTDADRLYNLRRRLRRNIQSLEKRGDSLTEGQRQNLEYFKEQLGNLTTIRGVRGSKEILSEQGTKELKRRLNRALQPSGLRGKQRRRFEFESSQVNRALQESSKEKGTPPDTESLKAIIFMQATKQHWQGLRSEDRLKGILEGLGVNSIAAAYDIVRRANPEVFAAIEGAAFNTGDPMFDTQDGENVNYPSRSLLIRTMLV